MTALESETFDLRSDPPAIPLLATEPARFGPVSRRLLRRFLAVVLLVQLVGALLTFTADGNAARAVGLGFVFPGGGMLFTGHPIAFVTTLVLLAIAFVLWWGVSAHFAIPLVWFGAAVIAGALADAPRWFVDRGTAWHWSIPVIYTLMVASVAALAWTFERKFRAKRARVPEINAYLAAAQLPTPAAGPREPNAMDAELLRWCLDFADQPADGLKGLDWGEQFHGGTQLRYQLNACTWAMSLFAANYVPNAPRQITAALERVILKHTDLRVWKYWRTLNMLGNFDRNPDPIVRDNIMFSAFLGDALNAFEAATGSTTFDEPGSLTFVWSDGRTFPYDHHTIVEAVRRNFDRSALGFFPCEPGWSFTVCNTMGAQSMLGHDRLHGTDMWDRYRDRWRTTLEQEYLTPDGAYSHIRSNHVGVSWDTGEVPGGEYNAGGTGRFADILPAHGRRAIALDLKAAAPKMEALAGLVKDGTLAMEMPEELERHRTRSSPLPNWSKIVGGARMTGHGALAEAALDGAERQCATGRRWPERPLRASASALTGHMIVRWSTPLALADLNRRGYIAPIGPVLVETAWDHVMVTLARSDDGVALDLALEPRSAAPVTVTLCFGQLLPCARYELTGSAEPADCAADADGTASVAIDIAGALRLRLAPSPATLEGARQ